MKRPWTLRLADAMMDHTVCVSKECDVVDILLEQGAHHLLNQGLAKSLALQQAFQNLLWFEMLLFGCCCLGEMSIGE